MSAIQWKKGVKDGGHYFGATIIDNILNTVIYSEDACKRIYKLIIKKKYNQTPTSQISWPWEYENDNIELSWNIYIYIYI